MVKKEKPLKGRNKLILRKSLFLVMLAMAIVAVSIGGCASKNISSDKEAAQAITTPDAKAAKEPSPDGSKGSEEEAPSADAKEGRIGADNSREMPRQSSLGESNSKGASLGAEEETLDGKTDRRKEIEAFAERVQEAVADRNLESIANLTTFPLEFLTTDEDSLYFKDRNEFLKQNPDMIFGDDLMTVIANVDTGTLELRDDGVTMGTPDGPHIRYAMGTNGSFGIVDIQE